MKSHLLSLSALVLAAGIGSTIFAGSASAFPAPGPTQEAKVWFQSFQRSGPDAPCVAPAALDIAWQEDWPASENGWTPSWAKWPSGGTGGWVCNRQITWSPALYDLID